MTRTHDHAHSLSTAFAIAVICNLIFTVVEIYFAYRAHSMTLYADAAHNFGDVFGLVLAWGANWLLTLPANKRYSYGYKRTTILASLVNAFILVATSALIAYEAIHKLIFVTPVKEHIIIYVAVLGIIINGGTALLFRHESHHDLNVKGAFLHLLADAFILVGVVISGLLILLTKKMWIDPVMGLLIVGIILFGTWGLLRDSVSLILDAIPHFIDQSGIESFLKNLPGVTAVHDLHIWGLSTKEIALTAHLVMPNKPLSDMDHEYIHVSLKQQFRVDHATIQVETGEAVNPCGRSETC